MLWPSSVLAVQGHGGAEGLVAHQIGHVFFVMGISYLLYKIYKGRFKDLGWFEFKSFLWLLICWNLLTFTGHWMREAVTPDQFVMDDGRIIGMTVDGAWDFLFYLTRLDHLLMVPAFFLLFLALRKWRRQT
jgi:hypothetical protein